jgi:hypothetical protein
MRAERHHSILSVTRRRPSTRLLIPALLYLLAVSCIDRSSSEDLDPPLLPNGGAAGEGPLHAGGRAGSTSGGSDDPGGGSGGSLAGGAGGIFAGGSGGAPAGGAPAGGQGTGTELDCAAETWFDGEVCQPLKRCPPGQYVTYPGSRRMDRGCSPCPPSTYSSTENASDCAYSGCGISELIIAAGSSTAPAECAPNPDSIPIDLDDSSLIGLAASGARLYAATVSFSEVTFHGFEGGAPLDALTISIEGHPIAGTFAIAPDETFYLSSRDPNVPGRIWLDVVAPDAASAARVAITNTSADGWLGLTSTPSHWVYWDTEHNGLGHEGVVRSASHSEPAEVETLIRQTNLVHVSAENMDRLFLTVSEPPRLYRLLDLTPPLEQVALPASFVPTLSAATATGKAYAIGLSSDQRSLEAYQIESNGTVTEHFEHRVDESYPYLMTGAIDPDRALYVLFYSREKISPGSYRTRNTYYLLRFDLTSKDSTLLHLGSGENSWMEALEVKSDGSVYVAGVHDGTLFVRKVY